jgi:hypothetical protein
MKVSNEIVFVHTKLNRVLNHVYFIKIYNFLLRYLVSGRTQICIYTLLHY